MKQAVYIEGKYCDPSQPSDHANRQDTRLTDNLEQWLEDWGSYKAKPVSELSTPCKTSLKVAEEMRPEQITNKPPKKGEKYTYLDENGNRKLYPLLIRKLLYDLENMWKKTNERSTRITCGQTPTYSPRQRLARMNKAVNALHEADPTLWSVVVMRYELQYTWQRVRDEIGLPKHTYYRRLKRAKVFIKKALQECN